MDGIVRYYLLQNALIHINHFGGTRSNWWWSERGRSFFALVKAEDSVNNGNNNKCTNTLDDDNVDG